MLLAGVALRERQLFLITVGRLGQGNEQIAVGQMQCRFHGVGQTGADVILHDQTVNDDLDGVLFVFIKRNFLGQFIHRSVNADADITCFLCILKDLFMHTLFAADDGGKHDELCPCGQFADFVKNLVNGLLTDFLAADRTVRNTDTRIQQSQVVVNFRDGTDGGTRVFRCGFLVDGNGGGQTLNRVKLGLIKLP